MSNLQLATRPTEMVSSLEDVLTISDIVVKSGMFPDIQSQAKAAMIILAGREVGIPPMAALRGMFVVKGKAEFHAGLLAAMIKASGKYDYTVTEHDEKICRLQWFDLRPLEPGMAARVPTGHSQFTIEDAKRADLIKPGSNWQKFPKAMLFARALTSGQRVYAPDIAIGAAYSQGEISEVDFELESAPVIEAEPPEATLSEDFNAHEDATDYQAKRMNIRDIGTVLREQFGLKRAQIEQRMSEAIGRPFERLSAIADSECQTVEDDLAKWLRELRGAQ